MTIDSRITLHEFVDAERQVLQDFIIYWTKKRHTEPENCPNVMDVEDWDEQFAHWVDET